MLSRIPGSSRDCHGTPAGLISGVGIMGYGKLVGGGGKCSYVNLALFAGMLGNSGEGRLILTCGDIELLETLLGRSSSAIRGGTPICRESSCSLGDVAGEVL